MGSRRWRRAYILFNNVYAYDDAVRFKRLLAGETETGGPNL